MKARDECVQTLSVLVRENQEAGAPLAEQAIESYCSSFSGWARQAAGLTELENELYGQFPAAEYPFIAVIKDCIRRKRHQLAEYGSLG
jgi:hypothetical protein